MEDESHLNYKKRWDDMFELIIFSKKGWMSDNDKNEIIFGLLEDIELTEEFLWDKIDQGVDAGYSVDLQFEILTEILMAGYNHRPIKFKGTLKKRLFKIQINKNLN